MDTCEHLPTCLFFNDRMANMPLVSEILKDRHCLADWASCARYQVVLVGARVPEDLFPDEVDRAARLVDLGGR